jgi:BirA family biotin operon repressor/biotin-[acetyl-CoA-carboxylase] ligase
MKGAPGRAIGLPAGYRLQRYAEVGSTNSIALERAAAGGPAGLWIMADSQTQGRGRLGRVWASPSGNLYASLLVAPAAPLRVAQQLSLVSGLAVFDAVAAATGKGRLAATLRLKWPNDLLVGEAKIAGILLESTPSATPTGHWVVIGIGINIAVSPGGIDRATTSLAAEGVVVSCEEMMQHLACAMASWLEVWRDGAGTAEVRQAWLDRGPAVGAAIAVRQGSQLVEGRYQGLDGEGALRFIDAAGSTWTITTGEVLRPALAAASSGK